MAATGERGPMSGAPTTFTIPARRGKAARVRRGQVVRVINTHGEQVVDTWAFREGVLGEFMSMEPSPLNLFMNIPVRADGVLSFEAPVSTPGSHVALRAEMDLVVAFSACPQDILPINGIARRPTEAHFQVLG